MKYFIFITIFALHSAALIGMEESPFDYGSEHLFKCDICLDEKAFSETKQLTCDHLFCRECMLNLINLFKKEHQPKYLQCPNEHCHKAFTEYDIEELTGADLSALELLELIRLKEWISQQPDAKQCPTADCDYMFLAGDETRVITCPSCTHEYCSSCLLLHNPTDISCAAYRTNLQADNESLEWKHNNTKPCPRCHASIQKNEGCKYMHCTSCNKEFCWDCLFTCTKWHENHSCNAISALEAHERFGSLQRSSSQPAVAP